MAKGVTSCVVLRPMLDSGTGLVHMSPDHGEDDFELCRDHGIEPVFAVDSAGMYRADWGWLGRACNASPTCS